MNTKKGFLPYAAKSINEHDQIAKSHELRKEMEERRSVRHFSDRQVEKEIIENLIMIASSAPSGANKQPWTFCAISNASLKKEIRLAAEKEEYINYHGRMSDSWKKDLEIFGTDWKKEFLEIAPWLIAVFRKPYNNDEGIKTKNYYVQESVGIACGFLINAIHMLGLVTLTHTPSPMNFLETILNRPEEEKAYLLLPVGYPAEEAVVPIITKKEKNEVLLFYE
jgi:iodotyrosine deiodinase